MARLCIITSVKILSEAFILKAIKVIVKFSSHVIIIKYDIWHWGESLSVAKIEVDGRYDMLIIKSGSTSLVVYHKNLVSQVPHINGPYHTRIVIQLAYTSGIYQTSIVSQLAYTSGLYHTSIVSQLAYISSLYHTSIVSQLAYTSGIYHTSIVSQLAYISCLYHKV